MFFYLQLELKRMENKTELVSLITNNTPTVPSPDHLKENIGKYLKIFEFCFWKTASNRYLQEYEATYFLFY